MGEQQQQQNKYQLALCVEQGETILFVCLFVCFQSPLVSFEPDHNFAHGELFLPSR